MGGVGGGKGFTKNNVTSFKDCAKECSLRLSSGLNGGAGCRCWDYSNEFNCRLFSSEECKTSGFRPYNSKDDDPGPSYYGDVYRRFQPFFNGSCKLGSFGGGGGGESGDEV